MIKSMTAYGRGKKEWADKDMSFELRSVNSRYFDCSVKLPRAYSIFEEKIKAYVQKNVTTRGKVDVFFTVTDRTETGVSITLDEGYLKGYLAALGRLRDEYGLTDDLTVSRVAQKAEIFRIERAEEDMSGEWERIEEALALAAADFGAMREAEGARISADLVDKMNGIKEMVSRIAALSVEHIGGYRAKLEARLRQVLEDNRVTADENRILTECAIMADKLAVDEELVRLGSHFVAFETILAQKDPAGRKLDFLMQEMNRETNTIGSKCQNSAIAAIVVDIKCELEKIREQIQNIE